MTVEIESASVSTTDVVETMIPESKTLSPNVPLPLVLSSWNDMDDELIRVGNRDASESTDICKSSEHAVVLTAALSDIVQRLFTEQ